jgi:YHS domain-containing protein
MIRLIMIVLLFYIGYRIIISFTATKNTPRKSSGERDRSEETFRDPVCGMYVTEEHAVIGTHNGNRHYFCSMGCLDKFREQLDHTSPT